jgi:hypothetical protein
VSSLTGFARIRWNVYQLEILICELQLGDRIIIAGEPYEVVGLSYFEEKPLMREIKFLNFALKTVDTRVSPQYATVTVERSVPHRPLEFFDPMTNPIN